MSQHFLSTLLVYFILFLRLVQPRSASVTPEGMLVLNSGSSGSVAPVSALGAHGCTTVCSVLAFPILRRAHTVALPGLELESALSPHPVWLLRLGGLPIFTAPDSKDELSLCLGLVLRGPSLRKLLAGAGFLFLPVSPQHSSWAPHSALAGASYASMGEGSEAPLSHTLQTMGPRAVCNEQQFCGQSQLFLHIQILMFTTSIKHFVEHNFLFVFNSSAEKNERSLGIVCGTHQKGQSAERVQKDSCALALSCMQSCNPVFSLVHILIG